MIALAVDLMMFHFFGNFAGFQLTGHIEICLLESDNRILPFSVNFAVRFDFFSGMTCCELVSFCCELSMYSVNNRDIFANFKYSQNGSFDNLIGYVGDAIKF